MDFESGFLENEDNFKEAFINNSIINDTSLMKGDTVIPLAIEYPQNENLANTQENKNSQATLKALNLISSTKQSNAVKDDTPVTYDAFIKLFNMETYYTVENKLVYIEILTRDFRGFMGVKVNKEDVEIIVKNSSYKGMLNMI
ncbi:hypothetical protein RCL_jg3058.t1 [Rhizophagus clarus]|uniref:Uncharacterized protein n=1 Tax=Rhizophagus clarus TaxID=94130 RepID=A0A8H3M9S3_9GLOM|nr:hypothetical protein RCL_jg3058.t1 [Rhizophagus clarus]